MSSHGQRPYLRSKFNRVYLFLLLPLGPVIGPPIEMIVGGKKSSPVNSLSLQFLHTVEHFCSTFVSRKLNLGTKESGIIWLLIYVFIVFIREKSHMNLRKKI